MCEVISNYLRVNSHQHMDGNSPKQQPAALSKVFDWRFNLCEVSYWLMSTQSHTSGLISAMLCWTLLDWNLCENPSVYGDIGFRNKAPYWYRTIEGQDSGPWRRICTWNITLIVSTESRRNRHSHLHFVIFLSTAVERFVFFCKVNMLPYHKVV